MEPSEKAKELVNSMYKTCKGKDVDDLLKRFIPYYHAKQCALICVEEIINLIIQYPQQREMHYEREYWKEVKQEINKL